MKASRIQVVDVTARRAQRAAQVLSAAFDDYPLTRYFMGHLGRLYRRRVREVFDLLVRHRLAVGWPCLAVAVGGRMVAAACADGPDKQPVPPEIEEMAQRFNDAVGPLTNRRHRRYARLKADLALKRPHYYLTVIGVAPGFQGRGYAGALLRRLHAISRADPASTGVALDTEVPANVRFYEHFGYRVHATSRIGGVPIWCLFRPNAGPGGVSGREGKGHDRLTGKDNRAGRATMADTETALSQEATV